jgi:hypothetical protein
MANLCHRTCDRADARARPSDVMKCSTCETNLGGYQARVAFIVNLDRGDEYCTSVFCASCERLADQAVSAAQQQFCTCDAIESFAE